MNCIFIKDGDIFKCEVCGSIVKKNCKQNCSGQKQEKSPGLVRKIVNFVPAAISHAIKGNPTVSEDKMRERLSICKGCQLYDKIKEICTHSSCGCPIKDNLEYRNKIAWADQECPIGLWGKVEKSE